MIWLEKFWDRVFSTDMRVPSNRGPKLWALPRPAVGWILLGLIAVALVASYASFEGKIRRRSLAFSLVSDVNEYLHRNPDVSTPVDWQVFAEWNGTHNRRKWDAVDLQPRFVVFRDERQRPGRWRNEVLEGELRRYEGALNERLHGSESDG